MQEPLLLNRMDSHSSAAADRDLLDVSDQNGSREVRAARSKSNGEPFPEPGLTDSSTNPSPEHGPVSPSNVIQIDPLRANESRATALSDEYTDEEIESLNQFWPRARWLLGLLFLQSTSSFILKGFQSLIEKHPSIVFFLTMLVGAGGNAGSQSVVLAVRAIALGDPVDNKRQVIHGFFL
jgi:hypothetical protein